MVIVKTVNHLRRLIAKEKSKKRTIGFVPTMGYLHDGHLFLMRKARSESDLVVLSIFVNPKQFAPGEDFTRYPRDKKNDELLAKKEKIDIIFYPSEKEMYPSGYLTYVEVKEITDILCGRSRPGHFRGVTTVVAKLLNLIEPDTIYLGQKDAQQAVVIETMIRDLNVPTRAKVMPTIREKDGLALSSRNTYLTEQQRKEAPVLYQALCETKRMIAAGERSTQTLRSVMHRMIQTRSACTIEYIEFRGMPTLKPLTTLKGKTLIALAVRFGKTRLIDNIVLSVR